MSVPSVASSGRSVEVPINDAGDVAVAEIVARLAQASDVAVERPPAGLTLSTRGLARALTRTLLIERLRASPRSRSSSARTPMVLEVDDRILAPSRQAEWIGRLRDLSDRATEAARRRENYGMRAAGRRIGPATRRGRPSASSTA